MVILKSRYASTLKKIGLPLVCLAAQWPATLLAEEGEFSGWVNLESRYYFQTGETVATQYYPSAAVQLDYIRPLNENNEFKASIHLRADGVDDERNLLDARELLWLHYADNYEFRLGVGQVAWGVNEVFKIADPVNQKDRAELPYQRKLGQPLAGLSFYWGDSLIELYGLYDHRPAWFPGEEGRLKFPLMVDPDEQIYDRGKTGKLDLAARWKFQWGNADISLSHFYGVTRDPYFIFNLDFEDPALIAVYDKVNQSSATMVYPWGDLLFKGEFTYQTGGIEQFEAVAGGFEFTTGGVFDSNIDITWYVEAIWDSRDQLYANLFDHDIAFAARLAFNDARDSNLILGAVVDYEYDEAMGYLLWINTFGQRWTLNISGQFFYANEPRLNPEDFEDDLVSLVTENPVPSEVIANVAGFFAERTLPKPQYDQFLEQLEIIQNDSSLFDNVPADTSAQSLFDLLRVSDNSQKMNLIERDAYLQLDLFYHF